MGCRWPRRLPSNGTRHLAWPDMRHAYGEPRTVCLGYIGLRLHMVVFTDRSAVRRIISLRKANAREVARYAQA